MDNTGLDEKLILRIASGDRDAFKTVYMATKSAVYGFALSILQNPYDAEDVMHDAYLKIYDGAADYVPAGKPLSWIMTIVRNLTYNRIRSSGIRDHEDIDDHINDISTSETDIADARLDLADALGVLDNHDREIVILHAAGGMRHREIAEMLNIPISTVQSRYNRALKKMREVLESKKGGAR